MYVKDTVLYKAMYCGLCKGIGCSCGTKGRFLLNYDLTFLSLFVHNVLNVDVKVEKQHCIIHHVKKRPVAVPAYPAVCLLAGDVIFSRFPLRVQTVEFLFQTILNAFPAINRTAFFIACSCHHFTPKNSLPFQRVPVIARATAEREE